MSDHSEPFPHPPFHSIPAFLFLPDLHRMDSPQLLSHLSQAMSREYPSLTYKNQSINLQQLLKTNNGPSIKKINDNREKYREIK